MELFIASAVAILTFLSIQSAYRNGVVDGYGFSKEPLNPGYTSAGAILRRTMAHRWPELYGCARGKNATCSSDSTPSPE